VRKLNYFQNKPKLPKIDTLAYLERLGISREEPSLPYLKKIQKAHQNAIPLENLWIHYDKRTPWSISEIFKRIVPGHRGGIGIELNFLLYHLLSQIGFNCFISSARLYVDGEYGHLYDHLILIVEQEEKLWLVDVGLQDRLYAPK